MKKTLFISLSIMTMLILLSCASTTSNKSTSSGRSTTGGVPQFVKDAVARAPEGTLIGVGTANMPVLSASRTAAAQRARAEISRQMNTMVQDMQRDYIAASEVDHSAAIAFFESITVNLSRSQFSGASVVAEDMDDKNQYWVVVMLTKAATVIEINQAQAAAKLAVPAMASFIAEERMHEAFDRATKQDIGYSDR